MNNREFSQISGSGEIESPISVTTTGFRISNSSIAKVGLTTESTSFAPDPSTKSSTVSTEAVTSLATTSTSQGQSTANVLTTSSSTADTAFTTRTISSSTSSAGTTTVITSQTTPPLGSSNTAASTPINLQSTASAAEGNENNELFGFETWHWIVIGIGILLVIVALILLISCCLRRHKKTKEVKKKKTLEEMWNTGGQEVPMLNIHTTSKTWKASTETLDDKITTAGVVGGQTAFNVFAEGSNVSRSDRDLSCNSAKSKSSSSVVDEVSYNSKNNSSKTGKGRKPLAKVEMPKVESVGSLSNTDKSGQVEVTSEGSEMNSVFEDNAASPVVISPIPQTFKTNSTTDEKEKKSAKNSKSSSSTKQSQGSKEASSAAKSSERALSSQEDLPPPPPPPPEV